eukprot:CAMPEP_0114695034 /NCGR_PEP_ID=MMETSP0191-20121206/70898_1 /TAXON_ID=126664 /ORGANISM="Sorites sp." /LENGTH=189 /DNA_ID=CAMNT_0001990761 /DNA_START=201 /DNA_END=770 /DNA_ORIENTATION=+
MSLARSTYQVICGDFNTNLSSDEPLTELLSQDGLFRTPTKGFTHSHQRALDHLCSNDALVPRCVLRAATGEELRGLPKKECPSDHLPVAATFEVVVVKWQCPELLPLGQSLVPTELLAEWSALVAFGLGKSGKKARREQKQLEESFLSPISPDLRHQLQRWRDTRRNAAVAICQHAVQQALVSLRAIFS